MAYGSGILTYRRLSDSGNAWNGNPTLSVDMFNERVGIGTASPTAKLEVNGQIKITGGTPGAGKVLTSDAAGLASWATPSAGAITG